MCSPTDTDSGGGRVWRLVSRVVLGSWWLRARIRALWDAVAGP